MLVQSASSSSAAAAHYAARLARPAPAAGQDSAASAANPAATVHISPTAREALAFSNTAVTNSDHMVEARLAAIKAKDGPSRTQEEQDYVRANDQRLAEIAAKPEGQRTAAEVDYLQKAAGFVNTFANLSAAEKALYDKAVASGNTEAAAGISQIALIRMGHVAGGADGSTYDPRATAITAANIVDYFSHSIVDPTGQAQSRFQALIQFLMEDAAG